MIVMTMKQSVKSVRNALWKKKMLLTMEETKKSTEVLSKQP